MINRLVKLVEDPHLKADAPKFDVGDTVDVHCKIIEGEKERVQIFSGTVIMRQGRGLTETFTVRRIVLNEGVERIFPVHSPNIVKLSVKRGGKTRRAKLMYLRDRVGKSTRLADSDKPGTKKARAAAEAAN